MKTIVAIPAYNAEKYLEKLLTSLEKQGFDEIYVLDDASTDGTEELVKQYPSVHYVKGDKNLGITGSRNRILPYATEGVILFLDADMELQTDDIPDKLRTHFEKKPKMAVLGALIVSNSNEPMWYNWGYDSSPFNDGLHEALNAVALEHQGDEELLGTIRKVAKGRVGHFEPIEDREVDWVIEGFFAVRADVFKTQNGFDTNFKMYHEGPDYCKRVKNEGFTVNFVTDIKAKHLDMRTGGEERANALRASTKYWYEKHYDIPDEIIERFFLW